MGNQKTTTVQTTAIMGAIRGRIDSIEVSARADEEKTGKVSKAQRNTMKALSAFPESAVVAMGKLSVPFARVETWTQALSHGVYVIDKIVNGILVLVKGAPFAALNLANQHAIAAVVEDNGKRERWTETDVGRGMNAQRIKTTDKQGNPRAAYSKGTTNAQQQSSANSLCELGFFEKSARKSGPGYYFKPAKSSAVYRRFSKAYKSAKLSA